MKYCENDLFHLVWVERVLGAVHLGPGDEVQRLTVRANVLDLADGLGGGGHVVGHVLLLGPGDQLLRGPGVGVGELAGVGRHAAAVAVGHHVVAGARARAGVAPLTQVVAAAASAPETGKHVTKKNFAAKLLK